MENRTLYELIVEFDGVGKVNFIKKQHNLVETRVCEETRAEFDRAVNKLIEEFTAGVPVKESKLIDKEEIIVDYKKKGSKNEKI